MHLITDFVHLGCFRTVRGPFGTCSGALSGLGREPLRDLVGVLSHGVVGVLSEAHRGTRKTPSEKYKASTACTLILSGWFRAHKKGARRAEMKHAKKKKGTGPPTVGAHQVSCVATEHVGLDR